MVAARNESQLPIVGRLVWMLAGPALLLLCTVQIVSSRVESWIKVSDALFFLVLLSMLLGRWVEHRGGNPLNSLGEPATAGDLRRYLISTAVIGIAIWVAANLLRDFWRQ